MARRKQQDHTAEALYAAYKLLPLAEQKKLCRYIVQDGASPMRSLLAKVARIAVLALKSKDKEAEVLAETGKQLAAELDRRTPKPRKTKRNLEIKRLREAGKSWGTIAKAMGMTAPAVRSAYKSVQA